MSDSAAATLQPTARGERLEILDVLRGFAILGILFVNIRAIGFSEAIYVLGDDMFPDTLDRMARFFVDVVIQGKVYTIFSFLFGVGMAAQATRLAGRPGFYAFFIKRLLVLLGIGLAHDILVWNGRILPAYALLGLLLLPFLKRKPKTQLIWAAILIVLPALVLPAIAIARQPPPPPASVEQPAAPAGESAAPASDAEARAAERQERIQAMYDADVERFRTASYFDLVRYRISLLPQTLGTIAMYASYMVGVMLLGMAAWGGGWFHRAAEFGRRYRAILGWGLVFGIAGNVAFFQAAELFPGRSPAGMFARSVGFFLGNPALALAYVAALVLWWQTRSGHRILAPLSAVGRTAMSNYLLQSLIGTTLYYGYGLGLYGRTRPVVDLVLVFVIFGLQVVVSTAWLRRYRFGPAEWLWRSLTYGRRQPMRVSPAP